MDKSKNVKYTSEQKQWSSLADQVNALNAKKKKKTHEFQVYACKFDVFCTSQIL